jgi:FkbM family methyltransferase
MTLSSILRFLTGRGRPESEVSDELLRRRRELEEARAAVATWKEQCGNLSAEVVRRRRELREARAAVAVLKQHGSDLATELERLRQQADRKLAHARELVRQHERRLPDPRVLEHLLEKRAVLMPREPPGTPSSRDEALQGLSATYRAALHTDVPGDATRVVVAGLIWWIPADRRPEGGLARRIATRQRLPLEDILATREAALGPIMLDIGANIGTTAIPRVVLGDVQVVYAAEPDPANYQCLVRNVADNRLRGFVLPDRVAIGSTDGSARLLCRGSIGSHRLLSDREGSREHDVITVECCTLDTWVRRLQIPVREVSFIKVDTQGCEPLVLAGAGDLLARRQIVWQLEFAPRLLHRYGCDPGVFCERLTAHFTHFIDLNALGGGARLRPVCELGEALAYVGDRRLSHTDVLVYHAGNPEGQVERA